MRIRPFGAADIESGLRLCRLSGWNQTEQDWRLFLAPPHGGLAAEADGVVIGTVAFLRYDPRLAWLAMMLVDPARRGAGIGTRLMEAAIEALAGTESIGLDASAAGEPLYRRFGFTAERQVRRLSGVPLRRIDPRGGETRPMKQSDLAAISKWDRALFGADRSWLLRSLFGRAPELAWIAARCGSVTGYILGRPGHVYDQLGPVAAEREETARALVTAALREAPRRVAIDAPEPATEWIGWLRAAGFETERTFLRMRRGEWKWSAADGREFAIAGPEFG